MKFIAALIAALALAFPATAAIYKNANRMQAILGAPPPSFAWDFTTGTLPPGTTVTRASVKYCRGANGLWASVAANTACFMYSTNGTPEGVHIEAGRTNNFFWNRDFTNAAWVKTSMTASLTATGVDGAANSASTLTATGNGGTATQARTIAATNKIVSAFIKRRTGSGTVLMSLDNCTTTIDVSGDINSTTYTRVPASSYLTHDTLNPTACVSLGTSGDAIDIDFFQADAGTNVPHIIGSPMLTVGSNFTRSLDQLTLPAANLGMGGMYGTIGCEYYYEANSFYQGTPTTTSSCLSINDGTSQNSVYAKGYGVIGGSPAQEIGSISAGSFLNFGPLNLTQPAIETRHRIGVSWRQGVNSSIKDAYLQGGGDLFLTKSQLGVSNTVGLATISFGLANLNGLALFGGLRKIYFWNSRALSNDQLYRFFGHTF